MKHNIYLKPILILITLLISACSNEPKEIIGYIEGEFTYMSSPVAGYLAELPVRRGNQVKAQQALFYLHNETEQQDVEIAKLRVQQAQAELSNLNKGKRPSELEALAANVAQSEAELLLAELDLHRAQQLVSQAVLDQAELDNVTSRYQSAQAQFKAMQADYETGLLGARDDEKIAAQANLAAMQATLAKVEWLNQQRVIVAPNDALVFDTYYLSGEWVNAGQAVMALLEPKQIQAVFFIPQQLLATIQIGDTITIQCDQCPKNRTATIAYISPQAEYTPPVIYDRKERNKLIYKIKAHFDNDIAQQFHPGQPITVIMH